MKKLFDTVRNSWFGIVFCAVALMLIGVGVFGLLGDALLKSLIGTDPLLYTAWQYASFIGIWIVFLLYYRFTRKNRPLLSRVGRGMRGNTPALLGLGLLLGFVMNGTCALVAWLHGDFALTSGVYGIPGLLLLFVAVFIQSSGEELVCRSFLYERFLMKYGRPVIAIAVNAPVFALLHGFNPGLTVVSVINLVLCGIVFSLALWATDSLWITFGMHAMWNYNQNVLLGLPNSGTAAQYSMLTVVGETHESLAYSTGFGLEGAPLCTLVYLAAAVAFYLIGRKRHGRGICERVPAQS